MNRGAVLFSEWLDKGKVKLSELSYDLRITSASLRSYRKGESLPTRQNALALRELAAIPIDAWDLAAPEGSE